MNVGEQSQLLTMRVPDGAPQSMSIVNNLQNPNVLSTASKTGRNHQPSERTVNGNFDDRLSQIQDYIQITTSLLHSINTDGVSQKKKENKKTNSIFCFIYFNFSFWKIVNAFQSSSSFSTSHVRCISVFAIQK